MLIFPELHLSDTLNREMNVETLERLLRCANHIRPDLIKRLDLTVQRASRLEVLYLLSIDRLTSLRHLALRGRHDLDDDTVDLIAGKRTL